MSCNFIFSSREFTLSASTQSAHSIWYIFENLQFIVWTAKRKFWSCLGHWSETAPCFLAVNLVALWFNPFRTPKVTTNDHQKMSQIKTTSKVSLKLTGRINLGRRGVCAPSSRLWTQPTSPSPLPRAWKGPSQAIAPTRTTNNSPRTAKSATNWNHRLFLKSTVSKIDPGHNPQAPTSPLQQTGKG